jgi:hypothetical protein
VLLEEIVDREMLGGFIVESGSVVLDGSLEGQLERMRRRLAGATRQRKMRGDVPPSQRSP